MIGCGPRPVGVASRRVVFPSPSVSRLRARQRRQGAHACVAAREVVLDTVEPSPDWVFSEGDRAAMGLALEQATLAAEEGEVPVGAVVAASDGRVLARAHNRRERDHDPTAHAEILALREAAAELGGWRLEGCTLYVTLEPCAMCAAAAVAARLGCVVWGAADPRAGFAGSLGDLLDDPRLDHRVANRGGLMAERAGALLAKFFAMLRDGG
jgi:tRNA(adenine34) deaminase